MTAREMQQEWPLGPAAPVFTTAQPAETTVKTKKLGSFPKMPPSPAPQFAPVQIGFAPPAPAAALTSTPTPVFSTAQPAEATAQTQKLGSFRQKLPSPTPPAELGRPAASIPTIPSGRAHKLASFPQLAPQPLTPPFSPQLNPLKPHSKLNNWFRFVKKPHPASTPAPHGCILDSQ